MTVASGRPRPARRGLTDFSLAAERSDIDRLATIPGSDGWLPADRQAAFDAFEALPAESNLLYTTYIDLRAVELDDAQLTTSPRTAPVAADLPDGTDGLLVIDLVREVPEAMKPRKIAVNAGSEPAALEHRDAA